jgi:hypothetical protein
MINHKITKIIILVTLITTASSFINPKATFKPLSSAFTSSYKSPSPSNTLFSPTKPSNPTTTKCYGGFGTSVGLPSTVKPCKDATTSSFLSRLSFHSSRVSRTLKRTTLANFKIGKGKSSFNLRGVVATRDIKKGEPIVELPYELCVDLGKGGIDVAEAGSRLMGMRRAGLVWEEVRI